MARGGAGSAGGTVWLSLALKASPALGDLRVSLAGSCGRARVTGSIVAVPGATSIEIITLSDRG
jgi:hypothetical protein